MTLTLLARTLSRVGASVLVTRSAHSADIVLLGRHRTSLVSPARGPRQPTGFCLVNTEISQQLEQSLPMPPTNHSTQPDHCSAGAGSTGQSKQRRRVGAKPVGALGEAGLRGSAGARTDASSKRPESSEGDRRAEEGSTALRADNPRVTPPLAQRDATTASCDARAWAHRAALTRCWPPSSAHGPRRHATGRRRRRALETHGAAAPSRQDRDAGAANPAGCSVAGPAAFTRAARVQLASLLPSAPPRPRLRRHIGSNRSSKRWSSLRWASTWT